MERREITWEERSDIKRRLVREMTKEFERQVVESLVVLHLGDKIEFTFKYTVNIDTGMMFD